jgi:zinc-binding alcohol dehydrogenase/oxidoreductase
MAVAAGSSVFVTSSSEEKIKAAMALGAKGGFNYKDINWTENAKTAAGGFDVIVDSAGGNGFASLTEVANAGARIVLFGRTAGNINNLRPGLIYNKQLNIMGTVMGTQEEFRSMLAFYEQHNLKPVLDKEFSLEGIENAFKYMNAGEHFGKITISIS